MMNLKNIKETTQWKQYEWLIAKIFHEKEGSYKTKVIYNTNIDGKYTEKPRQIDVLVTEDTNNKKTMIECKFRKRKLDVKDIESFLSMYQDVNATNAILISPVGFTTTANKRISQFEKEIKLEIIDWEQAYSANVNSEYGFSLHDICNSCFSSHMKGKEVPGLILWDNGIAFVIQEKASVFSIGKCMKCKAVSIHCQSCGVTTIASESDLCCDSQAIIYSEYQKGNI